MIDDIKPFLCSREECVNCIREGAKKYDKKAIVQKLSHSELIKIGNGVAWSFMSTNYDSNDEVFLFDMLNPKVMTKYILEEKDLDVEFNVAYALVCRKLQKEINQFYKEIQELGADKIRWSTTSKKTPKNNEKCVRKYHKMIEERLKGGVKQIRVQ